MSQRCEPGLRPAFDRPLLRLAWVVPASLCLWVVVLAGFSMLLGNLSQRPAVRPLEVSLADSSGGSPGGSPGGRPGPAGGNGSGGIAADRSLLAAAPHPPPARTVTNHVPLASGPPIPSPVPRSRRKPAHRAWNKKIEASAALRARRTAPDNEEDLGDDDASQPSLSKRTHVATPPPFPPSLTSSRSAGAPDAGAASDAGASPGGGKGAGSGATTGSGSGGEGAGTGGGAGSGSQLYAAVEHPPVPISTVLPEYPSAARARGLEGEVVLRAIVDGQGAVEEGIVVVESVPLLDRAAIEALRRWRFAPGRDAYNRPVRVVIQVPLRFRLR